VDAVACSHFDLSPQEPKNVANNGRTLYLALSKIQLIWWCSLFIHFLPYHSSEWKWQSGE